VVLMAKKATGWRRVRGCGGSLVHELWMDGELRAKVYREGDWQVYLAAPGRVIGGDFERLRDAKTVTEVLFLAGPPVTSPA
jgi:hypothetical protein